MGIAVGPVGRNAGVAGHLHGAAAGEPEKMGVASCFAYSHSKGLFAGERSRPSLTHIDQRSRPWDRPQYATRTRRDFT